MSLKKLLIIEDEQSLQEALVQELKDLGVKILKAADGQKGWHLIKKEAPDIVLLDLVLPKMDGFEILNNLKKEKLNKKIKIIVLTNLSNKETLEKVRSLDVEDCLIKSEVDLNILTQKIDKMLAE